MDQKGSPEERVYILEKKGKERDYLSDTCRGDRQEKNKKQEGTHLGEKGERGRR